MTTKLYYMPGACSLAGHIVLEWIGQPYETQRLSHKELKEAAYLRVNPAGAVPALDVNGWILTQNAAILNYLADKFPDAELGGEAGAEGRAEVNRWLGMLNADIHPAFKPLFGATAYLSDETAIEATKTQTRKQIRQRFEQLNQQLAGQDWLTGKRSVADPYLFVLSRWCRAMAVDIAGLDHLQRFHDCMNADSSVQKVLGEEGLH